MQISALVYLRLLVILKALSNLSVSYVSGTTKFLLIAGGLWPSLLPISNAPVVLFFS